MNAETRSFPRKPLRANAQVVVHGSPLLRGKTIDISLGGLSLFVADQIPVGQVCTVAVDALLRGNVVRVTAVARVVYSILKGTDGYRTGVQFIDVDAASNRTLAELTME